MPPVGIRILLSICNIFKWNLAKVDVQSEFLQTGSALRDVYVVPPRECKSRSFYSLLLTAAYGLVNANAKRQEHSNNFLKSFGFNQLVYVPQPFYKTDEDGQKFVAGKVVDDILLAAPAEHLRSFVKEISKEYKLGTIVFGPGTLNCYGLTIIQDEDYRITVHGNDKLHELEPYPIDRNRRR